ncbi:MAG: glycoside hydrolase family 65 protein [Anaerolineae bacterium]|nr:glycoside hydrolase family 65 protein [Anaerolineae bacterium]
MSRLWEIQEFGFQPDKLHHLETLFTIGNGYLGTRGSFEEGFPGESMATLINGVYDHAEGMLVPELASAPNWLPIQITVDGTPLKMVTKTSDTMLPPEGILFGYERTLHLDTGILERSVLFRAASGNVVRIIFQRFASLHDVHVLCQRVTITAIDGDPVIQVKALLDGDTLNLTANHWRVESAEILAAGDEIGIGAATRESGYTLGMASRFVSPYPATASKDGLRPQFDTSFTLPFQESAIFEKITAIYTSRDTDESPLAAAREKARQAAAEGYSLLEARHSAEWANYWDTSDIEIVGDDACQLATRFTTYHVLIAAPRHDENLSIPAKTLSGFGYKGHIFWDTELFTLPPMTLTQPDIARNLLMYRYHRLAGARHKASANGYEGAMYPWESTDTGEETTPQWSDVQPDGSKIRIWTGDHEQHISTDIAYAVDQFWRWTGDDEFMAKYGAEIILDTAKFWGSRAELHGDRYEISQQIGPDEYHENIDNSVFVNRMVVWHLEMALTLLGWLRIYSPTDAARLVKFLDLTPARLNHWRDVIARMFIPFDHEKHIHVQFPGFFEMEYIPTEKYQPRITSVQAILGHHRTIQTQVIKQADVVMLMALLGRKIGTPDETAVEQVMQNNWDTYFPRCDHGSSLSPAMHAWVAARLGMVETAYEQFDHAAHIDLMDNKGNVRDGMHAAACGGVWQAVVFGFAGLHIDERGELAVTPRLPKHWRRLSFTVNYRGEKRRFTAENPR